MKKSNYDQLMMHYSTAKTSVEETVKIEAMLDAIAMREINFLSEETEEFLYQKIKDGKATEEDVSLIIRRLSKLKVPGVNWLKLEPFEVFFLKEIIP